jgi:predicted regulator of Ras-like GTPase activity (Roadblock/LC7/MglB family)
VQILIPRALIEPQLAAGAVRVTFGQIRAATPEIFFHADRAPADAKILLPLEHVLRQITPCRRDDQRLPSIPVNIPSIFLKASLARPNGASGHGGQEPWYSQRRPTYETQPEGDSDAGPPGPANGKKPFRPLATDRPRRTTEPPAAPAAPPVSSAPAAPTAPTAPISPIGPISPIPAAADSKLPECFAIPLSAVLAVLPPEIRHSLTGSDATSGCFLIPMGEFEARMRTGKLHFKWGQLQNWCTVDLAASAAPDLDIDLPLAAVVPLFVAGRGTPEPRKQVEVDTRIPDLFSKSAPLPAAPPPPVRAEPPPAPAPAFRLEPSASPPPPAAPQAGPKQALACIRALDGVAGAFIATADGLLVAGSVPDANEEVLAAFAPTVFAQLTKYADMARLGLPGSIDIHLAAATVHVRKAGKLYLGVLMPPGHPLPAQELARISTALQPHTS